MSDDELRDLIRTRDADAEPALSEDKLRPLRSIWLELPDEEAPVRGLEALMAAASVKAREMAPPPVSMWQRFLDLFKQPPVLALATIVVLVGGAALVNRHEDTLDAVETVRGARETVDSRAMEPARALLPESSTTLTAPPPAAATGGSAAATIQPAQPAEPVRPAPPLAKVPPVPRPTPKPELRVAPTSEPRLEGRIGGDSPKRDGAKDDIARPPESTRPPPKAVVTQPSIADDDALGTAVHESATTEQQPTTPIPAQTAGVDQLLKQCQSAAARGDCPAVRVIADRIARANAPFYRSRVTKDSAIAKCLE